MERNVCGGKSVSCWAAGEWLGSLKSASTGEPSPYAGDRRRYDWMKGSSQQESLTCVARKNHIHRSCGSDCSIDKMPCLSSGQRRQKRMKTSNKKIPGRRGILITWIMWAKGTTTDRWKFRQTPAKAEKSVWKHNILEFHGDLLKREEYSEY